MHFRLSALACVSATMVAAQPPSDLPQTPVNPAQIASVILRVPAGTLVDIEIAETVSSRTVKPGDRFAIRLARPIKLDGRVIVPEGVVGVGQVVDAGKAGSLGKPAKLVLAARYLEFNGSQIPLRSFHLGRAGTDESNTALATAMIPIAGLIVPFMVRGGEIEIPPGAHAAAKLAADVYETTQAVQ